MSHKPPASRDGIFYVNILPVGETKAITRKGLAGVGVAIGFFINPKQRRGK